VQMRLDQLSKDCKGSPKSFWCFVNGKTNTKESVGNLIVEKDGSNVWLFQIY
jgi:hypothetical protein